jgi:hypothetical protein
MQMLFIANEPVLTRSTLGLMPILSTAPLAERAGFQVLDDLCTRIGVIGREHIWSEYSVYSCILGPDVENCYHEVEGLMLIHLMLGRATIEAPQMDFHNAYNLTRRLQFVDEVKREF